MAKLGILAGSGALPYYVAKEAAKKHDVFVIAYAGLAQKEVREFPHAEFSLLEINSIIKKLKEESCAQLVFIGKVERPAASFNGDVIVDIPAKLLEIAQKEAQKQKQNSDDMMMSVFVRYLEEVESFTIKGAEKICPDLTMKAGFLAGSASAQNKTDVDLAVKIARTVGDLNIGQAAVVSDGMVLAVEAAEGTDEMLNRVISLPQGLRGNQDERRGVLIKLPRSHQDIRIDMPTIGLDTLSKVSKAGLAGIVVQENHILIDDKAALAEAATKENVFIQAVKIK